MYLQSQPLRDSIARSYECQTGKEFKMNKTFLSQSKLQGHSENTENLKLAWSLHDVKKHQSVQFQGRLKTVYIRDEKCEM